MKRREFMTLVGAAAAMPLAARAQSSSTRTIGFLGVSNPSSQTQWTAAFVRALRELGWTEGQNLTIEYRWAEGRTERFPEIANGGHRHRAGAHPECRHVAVIGAFRCQLGANFWFCSKS